MKGGSLAILLGTKPKGDDAEEEGSDAEESGEDDYTAFAEAAFPDEDWTPKRVDALKQFVMACMEK